MNKIFVIGLSKTGTNSMCDALEYLGFSMVHYPSPNIFGDVERVNGCADLPTVRYYKELDRRFPGSKFILTIRSLDDWLKSVEKYEAYFPGHNAIPMKKVVNGYVKCVEGKGTGEIIRMYDNC